MTDKEIIIDDLNQTINRLQQECTTKGNELIILTEQFQCKKQECEKLKKEIDRYKQALEKIKDIVTQITFTVAGGEESPKWEWIRLYRSIVYEVSKIINEVKDAD